MIGPDEEQRMIDGVRDQLAERFPRQPTGEVARIVSEAYGRFADARIRDFVPVLVHRAAADHLRHAGTGLG